MNNLRLLIVDDEPLIRAGIRNDLAAMKSVHVAGESGSVADAVDAIRSAQFDLVLLDVQLPDGTGFDVIRDIGPRHMPAVVFVTAYDKYAIQAFEVNAVDYLLKPFDDIRLKESVERARERMSQPADWSSSWSARSARSDAYRPGRPTSPSRTSVRRSSKRSALLPLSLHLRLVNGERTPLAPRHPGKTSVRAASPGP